MSVCSCTKKNRKTALRIPVAKTKHRLSSTNSNKELGMKLRRKKIK
jgi:hypothetical protein